VLLGCPAKVTRRESFGFCGERPALLVFAVRDPLLIPVVVITSSATGQTAEVPDARTEDSSPSLPRLLPNIAVRIAARPQLAYQTVLDYRALGPRSTAGYSLAVPIVDAPR
jgi:hypothetical protein